MRHSQAVGMAVLVRWPRNMWNLAVLLGELMSPHNTHGCSSCTCWIWRLAHLTAVLVRSSQAPVFQRSPKPGSSQRWLLVQSTRRGAQ